MPARTRKIRHDDETRAKIQAAQIINRFMACLNGEVTLDAQQVSCGKALLNKILPDLQATELTVEDKRYVARVPALSQSTDEWLKNNSPTIQ